ncbi:MAG: hypothetical protein AB1489_27180 [Acidobacteriota bacterium]
MGYTTKFQGQFKFDVLPPAEVIAKLRALEGKDTRDLPDAHKYPSYYCQWVLTKDCMGLEWSGVEKFYAYKEWLQYIIDKILTPHGVNLSGAVKYQGEEIGDNGMLTIEGSKVVQRPLQFAGVDYNQL